LQAVRSQITFAYRFFEDAKRLADRDRDEATKLYESSQRLVRTVPTLSTYSARFDEVAAGLTPQELDVAKNVVTYYNAMRVAFPEKLPDVAGLATLEQIAHAGRVTISPLFWLRHPVQCG